MAASEDFSNHQSCSYFVYLSQIFYSMNESELTPKEIRRYQRQMQIREIDQAGQKKLKEASVLVIGAGGLGCPVLQYLAAAGVGTLGVMDDEKVDESNLQRQVLYGSNDLGKHKAIIASKRIREMNDLLTINTLNIKFSRTNALEILNDYDVVVDATDNFESRYLINDACVIKNKPLVYGAIYKFEGQVSVFNHQEGPTLRCLMADPPKREEAVQPEDVGVIGVLPGIIGTIQANEVLKLITGYGPTLSGLLLVFNILGYKAFMGKIKPVPENRNISSL